MAGITLETAQSQLDAYLAAETAVLSGQMYKIGERMLHRADLEFIQKGIIVWDDRVKNLSNKAAGRSRAVSVRPGW